MKALIDADILVYRVGFASMDVDEGIARWRLDEFIQRIIEAVDAKETVFFLTSQDKSNFRFELYPEYKANRVQPKPTHYLLLRNYLIDTYKAVVVEGEEADDALGIAATADPKGTVICTIDKDLDQVAGEHFNFVTLRRYTISPIEALRSFYEQVLVGDKQTDNVEGCPKIGKVKANRMLEGCQDETEMLAATVGAYQKAYGSPEWSERLLLAGRLLWIRKFPGQDWSFRGLPVSKMLLDHFSEVIESTSSTNLSSFHTDWNAIISQTSE